jgi:hypothetical protein
LKPKARLFAEPLRFAAGELVLAAGYTPTIDADVLAVSFQQIVHPVLTEETEVAEASDSEGKPDEHA